MQGVPSHVVLQQSRDHPTTSRQSTQKGTWIPEGAHLDNFSHYDSKQHFGYMSLRQCNAFEQYISTVEGCEGRRRHSREWRLTTGVVGPARVGVQHGDSRGLDVVRYIQLETSAFLRRHFTLSITLILGIIFTLLDFSALSDKTTTTLVPTWRALSKWGS